MTQEQPKMCPFANVNCRQDRCALWVEVTTIREGPMPEIKDREVAGMCAFMAQLKAIAVNAGRPPMMMVPRMMRRPGTGG